MTPWNGDSIRALERGSIRAFVMKHRRYLTGRVLDFGAGKPGTCLKPQPYRDLVGGEYVPVDEGDLFPDGLFDAILFTQVIQYVADPPLCIRMLAATLRPGGHLVMTAPTNWDEVESTDLWRFTKAGMERLMLGAGLVILHHERRAEINLGGFRFPLGYGVVARKA